MVTTFPRRFVRLKADVRNSHETLISVDCIASADFNDRCISTIHPSIQIRDIAGRTYSREIDTDIRDYSWEPFEAFLLNSTDTKSKIFTI